MPDTKGLIDPSTFHPTSAQLRRGAHEVDGWVRQVGQVLAKVGVAVAEHTSVVADRWVALGECYQAPETERVLGLIAPAVAEAGEVAGALNGVKIALDVYADALLRIAGDLATLETEAAEFRVSDGVLNGVKDKSNDAWTAANGLYALGHLDVGGVAAAAGRLSSDTVPWWQDEGMIAKNNGYWDRLYEYQQDIEQAASMCSMILCSAAAPQLLPAVMTAGVDSVEQIAAFDAAQGWGRPRDRGLQPLEQTWTSVNLNVVAPLAALSLGWDTTTMKGFSQTWTRGAEADQARNQVRAQAWNGLGQIATAFGASYAGKSDPVRSMMDARYGQGWTDQQDQIVADTAMSMVGYDPSVPEDGWHKFSDAPYEAGTTVTLNVGGILVGPKGLGAAGKAGMAGRAGLAAVRSGAEVVGPAVRAAERAGTAGSGAAHAAGALEVGARAIDDLGHVRVVRAVPESPHVPSVSGLSDGAVRRGTQSWLYDRAPVEPSAAERAAGARVREPVPDPVPVGDRALVGAESGPRTGPGATLERPGAPDLDVGPGRTVPADAPTGGGRGGGHDPAQPGPGHLSGPDGGVGDGTGPAGGRGGGLPDDLPGAGRGVDDLDGAGGRPDDGYVYDTSDDLPGGGVVEPVDHSGLPPRAQEAIGAYEQMIRDELAKPPDQIEYWKINRWRGSIFNWENYHRYPANEVILDLTDPATGKPLLNANGNPRRAVLDSYDPGEKIVSRKRTQLSAIQESTAREYINQALRLYGPNKPGITIADVPTTKTQLGSETGAIGRPLEGRLILEVPVQRQPIPDSILEYAAQKRVVICDVNGTVYRLGGEAP